MEEGGEIGQGAEVAEAAAVYLEPLQNKCAGNQGTTLQRYNEGSSRKKCQEARCASDSLCKLML